jgi:hypothetical protein
MKQKEYEKYFEKVYKIKGSQGKIIKRTVDKDGIITYWSVNGPVMFCGPKAEEALKELYNANPSTTIL